MATAASRRFSSRSRLLLAAAAGAVVVAALVGAGMLLLGDDDADARRAAAEEYVETVNRVHRGAAIELDKVSRTYERMRLDPAELRRQQHELADAERSLGRLRSTVRRIVPPPEAQRVHEELLELLRTQVELAAEVAQLAIYVPLWAEQAEALDAATNRLRSDLQEAETGEDQQRAFALYRRDVARAAEALSKLSAPEVLESPRRQEVARLRRVHGLAGEVREALRDGEPERVTALFERLADASSTAGTSRTQRAAVDAYNRRIEHLNAQRAAVERELARLREHLA